MNMNREPLLTSGFVVAVVGAILTLVVEFGVDLTKDQVAAILGLATVISPLVVAAFARPKVTPMADPRLPGGRGGV